MILSGEGYDVHGLVREAAIKFAKDRRFDLAAYRSEDDRYGWNRTVTTSARPRLFHYRDSSGLRSRFIESAKEAYAAARSTI